MEIKKAFYQEHPEVAALTEEEVAQIRSPFPLP